MPGKITPVITWQIGATTAAGPLATPSARQSSRAGTATSGPALLPVSLAARTKSISHSAGIGAPRVTRDTGATRLLGLLANLRMPGTEAPPPRHTLQTLSRYLAARLRQNDEPALLALAAEVDSPPAAPDAEGTTLPPPLRDAVDRIASLEAGAGDPATPYHVTLHRAPPGVADRMTRAARALAASAAAGPEASPELLAAARGDAALARRIGILGSQDPRALLSGLGAHWEDRQSAPVRLLASFPHQPEQHVHVAMLPDGSCRVTVAGMAHGISVGADDCGQPVLLDPELSRYACQMSYTISPDGMLQFDEAMHIDCTAVRLAPAATIPDDELALLERVNRAFPDMAQLQLDAEDPDHGTLYARDRFLNAVRDGATDLAGVAAMFRGFVEQLAGSGAQASPAITTSLPEALYLLDARLAAAGGTLPTAQRHELANSAGELSRLCADSLSGAWQALLGQIVQACRT